jgi:hypothetical protein
VEHLMSATDDGPLTVLERYDVSSVAGPVVTAAAFVQCVDARNALRNSAALALHRLHKHISAVDTAVVRAWTVDRLVPLYAKPPHRMRPKAAHDIFETVLHWWLEGTCPSCEGRSYELVYPGAQVVGDVPCHLCHGAGREPVAHRLPRRYHDAGRWLADQYGSMLLDVQREMSRRLR